ncbi:hypothetical protein SAMN06265371_102182 [Lutibacter agarilyticus]|uniref:Uncharacterized protein n=1 Tax=Lutibacter agarilyticus TaxID=1109740 RepID=A0A238VXR6_9FLAO|nr:hypothetical protein [Lutibacter agarilyticus]SNR38643.1 hypothetical protein SAMN06265371_102182 [Lutibacter agarilyticus]
MSFGGHVNDMINRVKQNAALKNARRVKFKGGNDYTKTKNIKTEYSFPKLSKEELKALKLKVQEEAKQEKIKRLKFWGFITIIVLLLLLFFINY